MFSHPGAAADPAPNQSLSLQPVGCGRSPHPPQSQATSRRAWLKPAHASRAVPARGAAIPRGLSSATEAQGTKTSPPPPKPRTHAPRTHTCTTYTDDGVQFWCCHLLGSFNGSQDLLLMLEGEQRNLGSFQTRKGRRTGTQQGWHAHTHTHGGCSTPHGPLLPGLALSLQQVAFSFHLGRRTGLGRGNVLH